MRLRPSYFLKLAQIGLIVAILWRVFSKYQICGRFVETKKILRHGIAGTCHRMFFYFPPQLGQQIDGPNQLPRLRLWWHSDGHKFLPPHPEREDLERMAEEIRKDISNTAQNLFTGIEQKRNAKRWVREQGEEKEEEKQARELENRSSSRLEFILESKESMLPEQEETPAELAYLDGNTKPGRVNSAELFWPNKNRAAEFVPKRIELRKNILDDFRLKRESELPWLAMKKSALLPHEETKLKPKLGHETANDNRIDEPKLSQTREQPARNEEWKLNSEEKVESAICFQLNLQDFYSEEADNLGWASPLAILASRSVATVAVAFAHLLLLFAQVYLLNCLEVDNLWQRRGKLFLELLIVLLGCLGWLVVVVMKVRLEMSWQLLWLCTNFRPTVLPELVVVQVLASALLLLGIFEGVHIFARMRKCIRKIELEMEKDMKPQRPPV